MRQNKVISSPNICVHRVLLFMQGWRAPQKHEDQCKIDALMEKIRKKHEETMGGSQIMAGVVALSESRTLAGPFFFFFFSF